MAAPDEAEIQAAFRKWWRDYNLDSDDLPGDVHVAEVAFRAGYHIALNPNYPFPLDAEKGEDDNDELDCPRISGP